MDKNNNLSIKEKEKKLNDFISIYMNPNANKLISKSNDLVTKFKSLNDALKEIIQVEKDLKVREMLAANKKVELLNLERRLKEKNTMKVDLQNVLECYLIILKNNEELLNRRIEDLRIKDTHLRQKEFILNKIILARRKNKLNNDNTRDITGISGNNDVGNLGNYLNDELNKNNENNVCVTNEEFFLGDNLKKTWQINNNIPIIDEKLVSKETDFLIAKEEIKTTTIDNPGEITANTQVRADTLLANNTPPINSNISETTNSNYYQLEKMAKKNLLVKNISQYKNLSMNVSNAANIILEGKKSKPNTVDNNAKNVKNSKNLYQQVNNNSTNHLVKQKRDLTPTKTTSVNNKGGENSSTSTTAHNSLIKKTNLDNSPIIEGGRKIDLNTQTKPKSNIQAHSNSINNTKIGQTNNVVTKDNSSGNKNISVSKYKNKKENENSDLHSKTNKTNGNHKDTIRSNPIIKNVTTQKDKKGVIEIQVEQSQKQTIYNEDKKDILNNPIHHNVDDLPVANNNSNTYVEPQAEISDNNRDYSENRSLNNKDEELLNLTDPTNIIVARSKQSKLVPENNHKVTDIESVVSNLLNNNNNYAGITITNEPTIENNEEISERSKLDAPENKVVETQNKDNLEDKYREVNSLKSRIPEKNFLIDHHQIESNKELKTHSNITNNYEIEQSNPKKNQDNNLNHSLVFSNSLNPYKIKESIKRDSKEEITKTIPKEIQSYYRDISNDFISKIFSKQSEVITNITINNEGELKNSNIDHKKESKITNETHADENIEEAIHIQKEKDNEAKYIKQEDNREEHSLQEEEENQEKYPNQKDEIKVNESENKYTRPGKVRHKSAITRLFKINSSILGGRKSSDNNSNNTKFTRYNNDRSKSLKVEYDDKLMKIKSDYYDNNKIIDIPENKESFDLKNESSEIKENNHTNDQERLSKIIETKQLSEIKEDSIQEDLISNKQIKSKKNKKIGFESPKSPNRNIVIGSTLCLDENSDNQPEAYNKENPDLDTIKINTEPKVNLIDEKSVLQTNGVYDYISKTSTTSISRYIQDDTFEEEDEEEEDTDKMKFYEEYVKKMQEMAEETKKIEANMKQFASTIGITNS